MDSAAIALAARVVLAAVLLVAGVAKLRSPAATRTQTVDLVGPRFGGAVAIALPIVETVVAVGLVAIESPVPGVAAALLLLAFTGVLVRAQARHLPCPCFGSAASTPVGPRAIVRNGVLVAYAVLATGSPTGASMGAAIAGIVVLGIIAAAAVWFGR